MPQYTLQDLRGFERNFNQIYPAGVLSRFSLEDRVAIVTGSGQGLGRGVALCFAGAGAHVVIADMRTDTCEATAEEVRALGRKSLPVIVDVTKAGQVKSMVEKVMAEFGRIDILHNNAGGGGHHFGPRFPDIDVTEEDWNLIMERNLKSTLLCTQAVAKAMIAKKNSGSIINTSSRRGLRGIPGSIAYGAAKAGVVNFTEAMSISLAEYNIRVNCIAPGRIHTPVTASRATDKERVNERGIPMGRIGQPEEIALTALFFASDASSYITGQVIEVDGGRSYGAHDLAAAKTAQVAQKKQAKSR
jgi:NAD(P)-dependent dehydrogenase (short-subunit alcohol dehydrogenase family)